MLSEKIRCEDYEEYQIPQLTQRMERGSIFINDEVFLEICQERVFVLKDLFYNEVIRPDYYESSLKKQVEELIQKNELCNENALFSRPEQHYLNYILNKAEYSNGLDLRNRYVHDTCSQNEKAQHYDYCELQKIMVLIILKINEELCMKAYRQNEAEKQ